MICFIRRPFNDVFFLLYLYTSCLLLPRCLFYNDGIFWRQLKIFKFYGMMEKVFLCLPFTIKRSWIFPLLYTIGA